MIKQQQSLKRRRDRRQTWLIVLLITGALMLCAVAMQKVPMVGATEPTVLSVGGSRGQLLLSLNEEPTGDLVSYYEVGQSEALTATVQWVDAGSVWTTTVASRGWTAFKVLSDTYEAEVSNVFWQDAPNDETGWFQLSEISPTVMVSGNTDIGLVAWGIWGDESVEYWEQGQHHVLTGTWQTVAADTYELQVDAFGWSAFKIVSWPDVFFEDDNPYWVHGGTPGWVIHNPKPWRLFLPWFAK